jgi:hypothetical protein
MAIVLGILILILVVGFIYLFGSIKR